MVVLFVLLVTYFLFSHFCLGKGSFTDVACFLRLSKKLKGEVCEVETDAESG